jgi:hypothetical protein
MSDRIFDLTHEDREEIQCLLAEIELHPDHLKVLLAELVLNRKIVRWARAYPDRFPAALRDALHALARRGQLARIAANDRAELEG